MTIKIKKLEWENDTQEYYFSGCPIGNYVAVYGSREEGKKGWGVLYDPTGVDEDHLLPWDKEDPSFETLDEAKAACQEHFESIIRECLEN